MAFHAAQQPFIPRAWLADVIGNLPPLPSNLRLAARPCRARPGGEMVTGSPTHTSHGQLRPRHGHQSPPSRPWLAGPFRPRLPIHVLDLQAAGAPLGCRTPSARWVTPSTTCGRVVPGPDADRGSQHAQVENPHRCRRRSSTGSRCSTTERGDTGALGCLPLSAMRSSTPRCSAAAFATPGELGDRSRPGP